MPPTSAARQFELISAALAFAEERESVSLTEVATELDITREALIALLTPVIYLEFRDGDGDVIEQLDAFDLDEQADMLHVRAGHWLRDWDASEPPGAVAVRLFLTATYYQATGDGSPALDSALTKLRQLVAIDLVVPTHRPPALAVAEDAYYRSQSLRFRYTKRNDDTTTDREVLPYDVYSEWSHWYVVGPEVGSELVKHWLIVGMTDAELGSVTFEPPADLPERGWMDLSGEERRVTVRIPTTRMAALPRPHRVLNETVEPDGWTRAEIEVNGDRYLAHLLISLGPDGEVIEPVEYRQRRIDRARVLLDHVDQG